MKKKTTKKYSRAFSKRDAQHYIIYSYLHKLGISDPYLHADAILDEFKNRFK